MKKVFITDYINEPDIELGVLGEYLSPSKHNDIQVLLVWHQKIDAAYIDALPNLKAIIRYGVGFDGVDIHYAKEKSIWVSNTPDYGTDEVSDTALAMILNIARGVTQYDFVCRHFEDSSWQENTNTGIYRTSAMRLGIIGTGRIGGSLCLKAKHLGFKVGFFDPFQASGHEKMLGVGRYSTLETLLEEADIVSINTPLTDITRGMVNQAFVDSMKTGASLVNTARGEIIKNLDVLYDALVQGKLSNLALDVLPQEPPDVNNKLINAWRNRETWLAGRFIINPHTAYYSQQSFAEMRRKAAENALRVMQGQVPINLVT